MSIPPIVRFTVTTLMVAAAVAAGWFAWDTYMEIRGPGTAGSGPISSRSRLMCPV